MTNGQMALQAVADVRRTMALIEAENGEPLPKIFRSRLEMMEAEAQALIADEIAAEDAGVLPVYPMEVWTGRASTPRDTNYTEKDETP